MIIEEIKYSFKNLNDISFKDFGSIVLQTGEKLIEILSKIDRSVLGNNSFITLDRKNNLLRVYLSSDDESRLPIKLDIFDSCYDLFIDDGIEYDLQVKIDSVDKLVSHIKELLESHVKLKLKLDNKGNRIAALYKFLLNGEEIANTGYKNIKSFFVKKGNSEIAFTPWLN